jgi:DNA-binding NtrC family response regulator
MNEVHTLLVVDDEQAICAAFRRFFAARGWQVRAAPTVARGLALWREQPPDVTFLDVRLPDGSGLDLLEDLRRLDPAARVVIMTAYGSLDVVARAVQGRAFEVLVKPVDLDRAAELAAAACRPPPAAPAALAPPALAVDPRTGLVGNSPAMQALYRRIVAAAAAEGTVLVTGETGSGKELVARALHEYSRRRDGPFVAVNCGALPDTLVESELFGHARGAFTGATADRPGRFAAADGGTLLLDEVGDLPLPAQVKLLRVLDQGVVEPLGARGPLPVDVRVVAATHRDLEAETAAGRFRQDLYYRLTALRIAVPPLRERRSDILPLAQYFLRRQATPERPAPVLAPAAAARLEQHNWPGNVRELRHAVEQAAVLAGAGPVLPEHLPPPAGGAAPGGAAAAPAFADVAAAFLRGPGSGCTGLHTSVVEAAERAAIHHALERSHGRLAEAAALLGIHRNTLRRRLRALGIAAPPAP